MERKANISKAQDVFLGRINMICDKFGLNNIMAQLYAILYLSDKPLSLNDMVDRLKISKGSASTNIRALERYGAVRQVWIMGSRKDYYEAEYDIEKVILDRIRSMAEGRLSEIDDMIRASRKELDYLNAQEEEEKEAIVVFKERLQRMEGLYSQAKSIFDMFNMAVSNKKSLNGGVHGDR
jgi:DNA-binding transcriptional regulator GbsR (MarR family)